LEKPTHTVTISKGFWMGQTPVTQAAFQQFVESNPSSFKGDGSLPVDSVTWTEAQAYCGKVGMRLPTEAEWEYAARAGSTASRYGSVDAIAWYDGNSGKKTHPVGQKQANAWGLFDMLGNVFQWTSDWYGDYGPGEVRDPAIPIGPSGIELLANGRGRVTRGGSWNQLSRGVRVSFRGWGGQELRRNYIGLRCVGE
jgi:formylglycine-generating enzyme required for sulfatase activity